MEAGPSWNFDAVPTTYKCDLCLEHKTQALVQLNNTAAICKPCFITDLRPKFEAAKANEHFWPVTFGTRLHPSSFPEFFTEDFIADYTEKEKEYTTAIGKRVYCAAPEMAHTSVQPKRRRSTPSKASVSAMTTSVALPVFCQSN
ncbi:hypothetical protein PRZ48_001788 [Zasmidium cellare]|uniref:Uncharacterized protein n=1 Tax=Zasmidium cellare TaxID=395010 RepID=A0ABR0F274_ZASCE|nr:hypothetical protein PRZ48_001788 [Zasmidium cellare]